jgi:hypothetical protein
VRVVSDVARIPTIEPDENPLDPGRTLILAIGVVFLHAVLVGLRIRWLAAAGEVNPFEPERLIGLIALVLGGAFTVLVIPLLHAHIRSRRRPLTVLGRRVPDERRPAVEAIVGPHLARLLLWSPSFCLSADTWRLMKATPEVDLPLLLTVFALVAGLMLIMGGELIVMVNRLKRAL